MTDDLQRYNEKRNFDKTDEPAGKTGESRPQRLRFVVQHHIASRDHYDFRLEWEGTLKSWAVPKGPSYNPADKRLAVQVEDHPIAYRNFEGTIPKGEYGGGVVMLWDEGEWTPLEDAAEGFARGSLKFTLDGTRLRGKWALVRMKPRAGEKNVNWLLIKEKDDFANAFDIAQFVTSVRTGRTMAEIEKKQEKDEETMPSNASQEIDDIRITSPDKVLFEDTNITKGDVARYYQQIAPRMMPYLQDRVISVVRCPKGIDSACFFKKHPTSDPAGIETIPVVEKDGETEEYYYITSVQGVLGEVQMNTLEFHTWGSRVETLEKPDVMVFDLDPDEGMSIDLIRRGVRDLKGILDQLSLVSYLKTSGGKGYHIVIPFRPAADWDKFHDFAHNIAKSMEAMWPDRYTSNVRKNQRSNRIFIDWLRNGRGATSVAPYSIRAREGAPVSMPIAWEELDTVAPHDITMEMALQRAQKKDPWEGFYDQDQELKL